MSSLVKRAKKEASFWKRIILLVGFKEAYFLAKNSLGMVIHPHLTTAKILANRDLSQALLVFGLPFNLWFILLILSFLVWFFVRPADFFFNLGLKIFFLIGFLLFLIALYDFYWVTKYLKKVKRI